MKRVDANVFSAEVRYEFTKAELEELIRSHAGLSDGSVEWDVSNTGKLRGATIKAIRIEIKGEKL